MPNYPKVAIIYLSYHCEPFLERALLAWKKLDYPKEQLAIVVIDNSHPNYGSSMDFINKILSVEVKNDLPQIVFFPQESNLGFSGGHNVGIQWAIDNNFDYVYFHNLDGFLAPDAITKMVEVMEVDKNIGAAQSLIRLYPQQNLINTSGNKFHYLGFGYCGDYRKKVDEVSLVPAEIGYASGAAMMARVELFRQVGFLDTDFFAYHEDLEFSLRFKALGYKIILAPQSVFYHEYEFGRNANKFYLMERNRLGLMLMYFQWRTLLLFLPVELGVSLVMFFVSIKDGWIKSWIRSRVYWLNLVHWKNWLAKRAYIQKIKKVTDRELVSAAVGTIEFDGAGMDGKLIKWGNRVVNGYWQIVKKVIVW